MSTRTRLNPILIASVLVALLGLAQFVACLTLAMNSYAGGNFADNRSAGYEMNRNWLSDLGRSKSWSGNDSGLSASYFNISIVALGTCLIFFFAFLHKGSEHFEWSHILFQACGCIAAIGLIGIGLTPVDRYYVPHHLFLVLWIVPMPVMGVLFVVLLRDGDAFGLSVIRWLLALVAFVLTIAIIAYAGAGKPSGYVVMQKIVVSISILWFIIVTLRVFLSAIEIIAVSRLQQISLQAAKYSERLKKGHLVKRDRNFVGKDLD